MKRTDWSRKALVLGRISLVRSLGREGIPVTLVREEPRVFERYSRYCREYVLVPNMALRPDRAVESLLEYGARQAEKPIAIFNGESDVSLFAQYREALSQYYEIVLADSDLVLSLIDKSRFARLAAQHGLPVPATVTPSTVEECLEAADRMGYPCVLKPVSQRRWHTREIVSAIGMRKAILVHGRKQLRTVLAHLPAFGGREMIQEYIPGPDQQLYDQHVYVDRNGRICGSIVGHKMRTWPIHFGMGCYTHVVDEPRIEAVGTEALVQLGYTGAANVNIKRHPETGRDYILEINPRFSLWTIIDSRCGVNMPLQMYLEGLGEEVPNLNRDRKHQRWLNFGHDMRALCAYRRAGEISLLSWLKSLLIVPGRIEFHKFALDDPLPWLMSGVLDAVGFAARCFKYVFRRLSLRSSVRKAQS